jgi:hypothetical protein
MAALAEACVAALPANKPLVLGALALALAVYALRRPATVDARVDAKGATSARADRRARPPKASTRASAPRPAARPRGQVVARAAWGSGPGALGLETPTSGAPEGPASFDVDAKGRVHVLDPVNGRVTVFEPGAAPRSIPLPGETYRDLALDPRGGAVAMDSRASGTIAFVDPSGKVTHTIAIEGPNVPERGGVTSVFARDDGVWVEVEHGPLVRVADASGSPDPARPAVEGRFSRDGKRLLRAELAGPATAVVRATALVGSGGFAARVDFPLPLLGLHELASDDAGRVYLAAATVREDGATFEVVEEHETVVVLDDRGAEVRRVEITPHDGPTDPAHFVRVGADGTIYELVEGDDGATIERYAP